MRPSPFSSSSTRASFPPAKNSRRPGALAPDAVIVRSAISPRLALGADLEVAVVVFVELLERDPLVGVEGVAGVRLAVAVAILLLLRLAAVAEADRGLAAPVAVGVGLAAQQRVAIERGDHLGVVVAGLILLFAHALAALVEAVQLGVLVLVGVDRLARLATVVVEQHDQLDHAVGVGVELLAVLLAALEPGDAVELPVLVRVGLAAHDRLAVGREVGDHVGLAAAVGVLFDARPAFVLVEDRDVERAVVVGVLLLGDLLSPRARSARACRPSGRDSRRSRPSARGRAA